MTNPSEDRSDKRYDARFRGVIRVARTGLEVAVLLAVLVASTLIVKELWPRAVGPSKPRASLPVPTEMISVADAPQKGNTLAAAVMIVFSDFQCPYCASFARDTLPQIDKYYVDKGLLKVVFRNFPLEGIHPLAVQAAEAGLCAQRQNLFWQWHDALFGSRSAPAREVIDRTTAAVGLDISEFTNCLERGHSSDQVRRELKHAAALGITGTPTFVLGSSHDGKVKPLAMFSGSRHFRELRKAIDDLLARTGSQ
jgi:protein-disulfide isomerase